MRDLAAARGGRVCPLFLGLGLTVNLNSSSREPFGRAKLTSSFTLHLRTGIQATGNLGRSKSKLCWAPEVSLMPGGTRQPDPRQPDPQADTGRGSFRGNY